MSETSEKLDHTLQAYGRLERKHGERGRELTAVKAERDAYKALILEALDYPAAGTPAGWGRRARAVLAGVVSTREKDDERPT